MNSTPTNTMTDEETIIDLKERDVEPDYTFEAAAGMDWGYINAWKLAGGCIAVECGNNGWSSMDIVGGTINNLDPMDILSEEDKSPLSVGTIMGIDAVDAASADDRGPFLVMASRDFYGPTSEVSYVSDEATGEASEFPTLDAAQAWIDAQAGDVYLEHNQSSGSTYKIVSE